ncbi:MAG: hypothetical protein ACKO3S_07265 [bacterium]
MRVLMAAPSETMRAVMRNGVRRLVETEVVVCGTLEDAEAACAAPFDLAVVDRELASAADWAWLGTLRERACPPGRLLVVGTRVSRDEAIALRDLGAGSFLLPPLTPDRLLERASTLLAMAPRDEAPSTTTPTDEAAPSDGTAPAPDAPAADDEPLAEAA